MKIKLIHKRREKKSLCVVYLQLDSWNICTGRTTCWWRWRSVLSFVLSHFPRNFLSFFRLSNFSVNFHYQRLSFVTAIKTAIVTINSWSALETEAHRQGISRNLPGTVTSTSLKVKYYPAPKSFNESCNCSDNVAFHDNFTLLNNWTVSEGLA